MGHSTDDTPFLLPHTAAAPMSASLQTRSWVDSFAPKRRFLPVNARSAPAWDRPRGLPLLNVKDQDCRATAVGNRAHLVSPRADQLSAGQQHRIEGFLRRRSPHCRSSSLSLDSCRLSFPRMGAASCSAGQHAVSTCPTRSRAGLGAALAPCVLCRAAGCAATSDQLSARRCR